MLSNDSARWDFTRRTHRLRWWAGYYLDPRTRPWLCERIGHKSVTSVDNSEGFDVVWCPRCGEVLRGYGEVNPLAEGWPERAGLHQLHCLLVHALVFGGGYASQAQEVATRCR